MKTENKSEILIALNGIGLNVFVILIGIVISLFVANNTSSNLPSSSNIGAIIPFIYSILFGTLTLICFFVFRKIFENYSWIITIVGIVITIFASTKV